MNCRLCRALMRVEDSRPSTLSRFGHPDMSVIRRRHACDTCKEKITTYQLLEPDLSSLCGSVAELATIRRIIRGRT